MPQQKKTKQTQKKVPKFTGGADNIFEERIAYYKKLRSLLRKYKITNKEICLESGLTYSTWRHTLFKISKDGIGDILKLRKHKLGKGKYGVVYIADIIDPQFEGDLLHQRAPKFPIALKIMDQEDKSNKNELKLNVAITTRVVKNKISRHFLLCYKTFKCKNYIVLDKIKRGITYYKYFYSLNELANGDINYFLKDVKVDENIVGNIIVQCFLCIMTFHKLGWVHQDSHAGNFLYQKTELLNTPSYSRGSRDTRGSHTSQYYHYKILGTDYYIPHYGYTVMLNDFGFAETYTDKKPKMFDYYNTKLFLPKFNNAEEEKLYIRSLPLINFIYDYNDYRLLINALLYYQTIPYRSMIESVRDLAYPNKFASEDEMIEEILGVLLQNNLIFTNLNHDMNHIIINADSPFMIDNTLIDKMPRNLPESISTPASVATPKTPSPGDSVKSKKSFLQKIMPSFISQSDESFRNMEKTYRTIRSSKLKMT